MKVIKRDGTPQEYNFLKIVDAVDKAFNSVEQDVPDKFLEQLKDSVERLIIKNNGDGSVIIAEETGAPTNGLIFNNVSDAGEYTVVSMQDWYSNNCTTKG